MTDLEIKDLLDYWAKEVEENAFVEFAVIELNPYTVPVNGT